VLDKSEVSPRFDRTGRRVSGNANNSRLVKGQHVLPLSLRVETISAVWRNATVSRYHMIGNNELIMRKIKRLCPFHRQPH
jgi:hypothetical protein